MGRRRNKKKKFDKLKKEVRKMDKTLREGDLTSRLVINNDVYRKILFWVDKAETEVSGLGAVKIIDGVPTVIEAILLDQECSGVETELNPESICKALYNFEQSGKPGEIRFWWHSHVNMPVYWSGTDFAAIEQLGRSGWFISTVFNKKRECRTAFYSGAPLKIFLDNIKTEIDHQLDESLLKSWELEFTSKVRRAREVTIIGSDFPYGDYGTQDFNVGYTEEQPVFETEDKILITSGLKKYEVDEIDDLRTRGWTDQAIAEYVQLEHCLVDSEPEEEAETQEIEELRRAGVPEADIYELMKMSRGSHAV